MEKLCSPPEIAADGFPGERHFRWALRDETKSDRQRWGDMPVGGHSMCQRKQAERLQEQQTLEWDKKAGHRRAGIRPRNWRGNKITKDTACNSKEAEFIYWGLQSTLHLPACSVPGTELGVMDTAVSKSYMIPAFRELTFQQGRQTRPKYILIYLIITKLI